MPPRKRFRDESIVASAMDLPLWAMVAVGSVVAFLGLIAATVLGFFIPSAKPWVADVGIVLLFVYLVLALATSLSERSRRRRRLEGVADLHRLWMLAPLQFEEVAAELFRLEGWIVTENKRPDDEDGGVDFEIAKRGETHLVQCKHWRHQDVGVKEARELWGVVASEAATGGVLVASRGFTSAAIEFAKGKRLELVTGQDFLRRRAAVVSSSFDPLSVHDPMVSDGFGAHLASVHRPACKLCGKPMVLVTTLTDVSITRQFWGCSGYPAECQGTRPFRAPYLGGVATPLIAAKSSGPSRPLDIRN